MVNFWFLEHMIDQKAVGNLELGTDLEVDNPEAHTKAGVDKDPEEHIDFWVDLGVCTVLKVDTLEVCTVLGVVPQNNMIPQFVLGKSYLEVDPQVVTDFLKVAPQAVTDYLEVAPQAATDFPEISLQVVTDCLEVADSEYYQTS